MTKTKQISRKGKLVAAYCIRMFWFQKPVAMHEALKVYLKNSSVWRLSHEILGKAHFVRSVEPAT